MTVTNINTSNVTPEQIGACTKVFDGAGIPFYKVVNSKAECDEQGHLIEYSVKAIFKGGQWHLTCDCKAGQDGRLCWHKRAAMAAAAEERHAMAEQAALNEAAKKVEPVAADPRKTRKSFDEGEALNRSRMRGIADILEARQMARESMPHAYKEK